MVIADYRCIQRGAAQAQLHPGPRPLPLVLRPHGWTALRPGEGSWKIFYNCLKNIWNTGRQHGEWDDMRLLAEEVGAGAVQGECYIYNTQMIFVALSTMLYIYWDLGRGGYRGQGGREPPLHGAGQLRDAAVRPRPLLVCPPQVRTILIIYLSCHYTILIIYLPCHYISVSRTGSARTKAVPESVVSVLPCFPSINATLETYGSTKLELTSAYQC